MHRKMTFLRKCNLCLFFCSAPKAVAKSIFTSNYTRSRKLIGKTHKSTKWNCFSVNWTTMLAKKVSYARFVQLIHDNDIKTFNCTTSLLNLNSILKNEQRWLDQLHIVQHNNQPTWKFLKFQSNTWIQMHLHLSQTIGCESCELVNQACIKCLSLIRIEMENEWRLREVLKVV